MENSGVSQRTKERSLPGPESSSAESSSAGERSTLPNLETDAEVPPDSNSDVTTAVPETDPDSTAGSAADIATPSSEESTNLRERSWRIASNRGILRVGIDPTIGYTYLRTNPDSLTYEGFEWEILQGIAAELEIKLDPVYVPWVDQMEALQDNRVDMIFGGREAIGIDTERFAATAPYYRSPQRIVVRENFSDEIHHLSDLFGRKVGIVADSAGAAILEVFNKDRANALHLISNSDPAHLFEQLRLEQLDAVVIDQPIAVAEVSGLTAARGSESPQPSVPDTALQDSSSANRAELPGDREQYTEDVVDRDESRPSIPDGGIPEELELSIVGEPMFPTPLVGVVNVEHVSMKQAIDGAISNLERNGTITAILEKWEL